jgi:hypothetical protein
MIQFDCCMNIRMRLDLGSTGHGNAARQELELRDDVSHTIKVETLSKH